MVVQPDMILRLYYAGASGKGAVNLVTKTNGCNLVVCQPDYRRYLIELF